MKTFDDIGTARAAHEISGGWLLDLGDGVYQVPGNARLTAKQSDLVLFFAKKFNATA
jgi:hypothetical protein|tara:strand:+ start:312 stop:482 length:171 start_codon:yes stop_codon:yes gene_type:complete